MKNYTLIDENNIDRNIHLPKTILIFVSSFRRILLVLFSFLLLLHQVMHYIPYSPFHISIPYMKTDANYKRTVARNSSPTGPRCRIFGQERAKPSKFLLFITGLGRVFLPIIQIKNMYGIEIKDDININFRAAFYSVFLSCQLLKLANSDLQYMQYRKNIVIKLIFFQASGYNYYSDNRY